MGEGVERRAPGQQHCSARGTGCQGAASPEGSGAAVTRGYQATGAFTCQAFAGPAQKAVKDYSAQHSVQVDNFLMPKQWYLA